MRQGWRTTTVAALAVVLTMVSVYARAQTADYIILQSHETLAIFDRYQQPIDDQQRASLLPYTPLRIVERDKILGDQITHALEVHHDGTPFYILRDESGALSGSTGREIRTTLRGCAVLNDTVEAASSAIPFTPAAVTSGGVHLRKDERVARVFRRGARCYVLRLSSPRRYGWCPAQAAWRTLTDESDAETTLPTTLRERLAKRVHEANESYRSFFEHFNSLTGQTKAVPRWRTEKKGEELRWVLSDPYARTGELVESTQLLVRDLQSILLGKPYVVSYADGELSIQPRTNEPGK